MPKTTLSSVTPATLPPYLQIVMDVLRDPKLLSEQTIEALLQILEERNDDIARLKREIQDMTEKLEEVQAYLNPRLGAPSLDEETEIAFAS